MSAFGGRTIKTINAGCYHNLVLTTDNKLFAWGSNLYNAIGATEKQIFPSPVAVDTTNIPLDRLISQVCAGEDMNFVVTDRSEIFRWGTFQFDNVPIPQRLLAPAISGAITQAIEGWQHVFFITSDNKLFAYGNNYYSELGNGKSGQFVYEVTSSTKLQEKLTNDWTLQDIVAARFNTYLVLSPRSTGISLLLQILLAIVITFTTLACGSGVLLMIMVGAQRFVFKNKKGTSFQRMNNEEDSTQYYAA